MVNLIEGPGHPVVWAESPRVPDAPTLLIYGHYDVQPPDPLDEWTTEPFKATVRDAKLYARGSSDDKGQVFCLLKSYEAVLDPKGQPPLNVHFIFEGEEESGGKVIFELLRNEPERTRADAALVCDMSYYAPGWPGVYTALRGLCYAEISVRTLERDLHSGTYGGVAPNAIETLVRILSELKSSNGKIRIPGLYEAVKPPTKAELDTWNNLPFDREDFLRSEVTGKKLTGLEDRSVFERVWALPTFEIHGIKGGFTGEGAKTVIPGKALGKVSFRLVGQQDPKKIREAFRAFVKARLPVDCTVEFANFADSPAIQLPFDNPSLDKARAALQAEWGKKTIMMGAGGSIPIVGDFKSVLGMDSLMVGFALDDDRVHSPNEKFDLTSFHKGIRSWARILDALAA